MGDSPGQYKLGSHDIALRVITFLVSLITSGITGTSPSSSGLTEQ